MLATKKVSELSEKKITKKQYLEILDGLSNIELKELSFENETTADKVKKCIDKISPKLKKNGECDKFAKVLINLLDKENISYEILGVWSHTEQIIFSEKLNNYISLNRYHYGIRVEGMVYDNNTVSGMNYEDWKMDMGGDEYISVHFLEEVNPQKFFKEMSN